MRLACAAVGDRASGDLAAVHPPNKRGKSADVHIRRNFSAGGSYNLTDFDYNHRGWFLNMQG